MARMCLVSQPFLRIDKFERVVVCLKHLWQEIMQRHACMRTEIAGACSCCNIQAGAVPFNRVTLRPAITLCYSYILEVAKPHLWRLLVRNRRLQLSL